MLNLKSIWMYRTNTSKLANEGIQRKQEFAWSSSMKINMSKGLVNNTFAYQSILTARWMSRKLLEWWCVILLSRVCEPCSLEAWSVGTMLYDWGRKVRLPLCMWASADLSGVAKAWKGRGAGLLIVCVHELLECVEPWLSLTLFLLPFSRFLFSLFIFF